MRRLRIFLSLLIVFVVCFSVAVTLQHRGLQNVRKNPPFFDKWNLSGRSGELLGLLALRYDLVLADFLWLRAIQSFGGRGMTNRDWRPLYNQFDTITDLDPYFEEAYTFGNMVIGDEGGQQREALGLLNKGMHKLVRKYRIPFEGMYVAHWQMGDTELARWYGRIAAKRADAPDWVPRVTAYLDVQSGEFYIGFDRFVGNLLDGMDAREPALVFIAIGKLKETIDKWNSSLLLQAYDEYTTQTGRLPERIEDLAAMPALQDYEVASMSRLLAAVAVQAQRTGRQGIDPQHLEDTALPTPADMAAAAETTAPTEVPNLKTLQNVIFQQSLVRRSGIPDDPHGSRYVLNKTLVGYPYGKRDAAIVNENKVREFLQALLHSVRSELSTRKDELGRWPESLREAFYTDFNTTEPFGGRWDYNPATGDFRSSTYPNY
jgi:hypothetical protein